MSRRVGRRALAVAAALAVTVLSGCAVEGQATDPAGETDRPLRIATTWAIGSLDPITEAYWAPEFGYGELLMRPTADGVVEPWLLESAEAVTPTEWELVLRDGVTFQNGSPCDADAVAAAINHQLANNPVLPPIVPGATAAATGPDTVVLTTSTPVSFLPALLAQEDMFPIYDVAAYESAAGDPQALVGLGMHTGPYRVTELTSSGMVLERYDDYWQGEPALPGVEVSFISDAQARVLAVQSGEVDVALYPPTESAGTLENSSAAHFVTGDGTLGPRLILNVQRSPMDEPAVRQALSAAIDYEEMANTVMNGFHDVAEGMYPMQLPYAVSNQAYDPDRAGQLLDQAGWVVGADGMRARDGVPLQLTLYTYRADPDLPAIAVALRSQLEESGIGIQIEELDDISSIYDGDTGWHIALFRTGYYGTSGAVVGVIHDYLTSDGSRNAGGIADPELDALADQLALAFDEEEQYDLLRQIQDIVMARQAYAIVVSVKRASAVVSDTWRDYEPSAVYLHLDWRTQP
ncbi:ABC transporter substrate-binding protein [Jiangella alba]|uniref:Peptide/nickel transport system substrate-binding protein n=1 Tax=Jiangella alba TaxID=561176 RepID=A0A1H5PYM5_9ACTN|nr:ABC transporter substrate-binding protein [Jiangella alba]SEF18960.1 peptide/nickel transport system substrate-binding protein [Jiangella alba]